MAEENITSLTRKDKKRSFEEIFDDVCETFQTIVSLLSEDTKTTESEIDSRGSLKTRRRHVFSLTNNLGNIRLTMLLLKEKKKVAEELVVDMENRKEELTRKERETLTQLLDIKSEEFIEKKDFIILTERLIKDSDFSIRKTASQMHELEKALEEAKTKLFAAEADFARKRYRQGVREQNEKKQNNQLYEEKIKELDKLERELTVFVIGGQTKAQVEDIRKFLRET